MAIAYVINKKKKNLDSLIDENINLLFIFNDWGEVGEKIAQKRDINICSLDEWGEISFTNIKKRRRKIKRVEALNYLVWRKFMIDYHFETTSLQGKKGRLKYPKHIYKDVKYFVLNNRSYDAGYNLLDKLETQIEKSFYRLLERYYPDAHSTKTKILVKTLYNMYYNYTSSLGYSDRFASIVQSQIYHLAIKLILDYGLLIENGLSWDTEYKLNQEQLIILSRLFNEGIVHKTRKSVVDEMEFLLKNLNSFDPYYYI